MRPGAYRAIRFVLTFLMVISGMDVVGQRRLPEQSAFTDAGEAPRAEGFRFADHDLHPGLVHQPYMGGPMITSGVATGSRSIQAFRDFLAVYEQRQGTDDNFTLRVLDNRTNETLEVYSLISDRARYRRTGEVEWRAIDEKRRREQKRLIDKWADRGLPRSAVAVRWGRSDEVLQARQAEEAFIEHEVNLARMLGLSLLATEIGTVETFNQDRLVSTAGARSRYQMMPYLLRKYGIDKYRLKTAANTTINVSEEWHPMLVMEDAFVTMRGYINATGHEIPGLSAYHTGPGNIYKVYEKYVESRRVPPNATVIDAYVWAVTDGYERVSAGTSFGPYSRAYVASAYGALRATEELTVDTTATFLAERVQIRRGESIYLSRLLRTLENSNDPLRWGGKSAGGTTYSRFRTMNPHINLPASNDGGVPVRSDIRLVSQADGKDVRFFLPLGATDALRRMGVNVLNTAATVRFDHDTWSKPTRNERLDVDYEYEVLLEDVAAFGFTYANRTRLGRLRDRMEAAARESNSPYRRMQARIIALHDQLWNSRPWEKLADALRG